MLPSRPATPNTSGERLGSVRACRRLKAWSNLCCRILVLWAILDVEAIKTELVSPSARYSIAREIQRVGAPAWRRGHGRDFLMSDA